MSSITNKDPIWTLLIDQLNQAIERENAPSPILREHAFGDDLGISSIEMVSLVIEIEDSAGVGFEAHDLKTLRTVGDAYQLLCLKLLKD